jgi:hypothetical protein
VGSAVDTTSVSSATMSDATEVNASTHVGVEARPRRMLV